MDKQVAKNFGVKLSSSKTFQNARAEFKEFSIGELKEFEKMFSRFDLNGDGFIDLLELKYMMEQLKAPQTHLQLKSMIKEVDEDNDGQVAYREFLLIFRYAKSGKLKNEGLNVIATSINVAQEGVSGAKDFFEAKSAALNSSVEEKDRAYRDEVKKKNEAKAKSKAAFKEKAAIFQQ